MRSNTISPSFNVWCSKRSNRMKKILAFIFGEFDTSSKREIKEYLIATDRRVWFITKNNIIEKFHYQTILNVNWFIGGVLERGLRIQYGKKWLEFDEMFGQTQVKQVEENILNTMRNFKSQTSVQYKLKINCVILLINRDLSIVNKSYFH
ncbi:hypothetical protein [Bacillus pseudomycoides]|uniref:hypothetical protein n=1 Tax=Bacillus pseudomycoides TaxID=64104 RepID=UPI003D653B7C